MQLMGLSIYLFSPELLFFLSSFVSFSLVSLKKQNNNSMIFQTRSSRHLVGQRTVPCSTANRFSLFPTSIAHGSNLLAWLAGWLAGFFGGARAGDTYRDSMACLFQSRILIQLPAYSSAQSSDKFNSK
jgi:hypothetical protein